MEKLSCNLITIPLNTESAIVHNGQFFVNLDFSYSYLLKVLKKSLSHYIF